MLTEKIKIHFGELVNKKIYKIHKNNILVEKKIPTFPEINKNTSKISVYLISILSKSKENKMDKLSKIKSLY